MNQQFLKDIINQAAEMEKEVSNLKAKIAKLEKDYNTLLSAKDLGILGNLKRQRESLLVDRNRYDFCPPPSLVGKIGGLTRRINQLERANINTRLIN